ncbi:MAG TPA: hypothetical protein VHZ32_10335 [Rhizomicrobium sp.]|nr:hypothetical protein [Rhizomicrobium sp.]
MHRSSVFAAAMVLATATAASAQDAVPKPVTVPLGGVSVSKPDDGDTPSISLSSAFDYSSGRYGAPKTTDILVGLTNLGVSWNDFQFSASLPYLTITGPSFVVVGTGGVPVLVTPKPGDDSTGRSGWGDLNLSATYSLPSEDLDDFDVAVSVRTKVATADTSKGLSTGATDFSFYVDVSRQFDIWGPFVNFGYRVPGKPSFYSFNDAPSFSVGTTLALDDRLVAIASYDFDGSISTSLADAQQIFASLTWLATDDISVTAYGEDGLSSGAPELGTGLLVSWKLR